MIRPVSEISNYTKCPRPECDNIVSYNEAHCLCGEFVGYPNYRMAMSEADDLAKRYSTALQVLKSKGLEEKQKTVEDLASISLPTICMSCDAADDVMRDKKYLNYHMQVAQNLREISSRENHSDRGMVENKLFPGYNQHLLYAALSPNGAGLRGYGDISITWKVEESYLLNRTTVLEENSFDFYDRHDLGKRSNQPPKGFMSSWSCRAQVAISKLGSGLNVSMNKLDIEELFFSPSTNRKNDTFMEVVIHAAEGLRNKGICSIKCEKILSPDDQARFELVVSKARDMGVIVIEAKS